MIARVVILGYSLSIWEHVLSIREFVVNSGVCCHFGSDVVISGVFVVDSGALVVISGVFVVISGEELSIK
ncbi:hypothetical protein H4V97_003138 [Flavobacterium sp. CG_23.5]|uniref:hypothetical protein n=1 Tax=Flavobacterium sp. CG_23.5 TaxID=2760708 RepID=UPI001AE13D3C|nr:hypothetical protein [Flavobacterium sp. CG_23.5]MBP2284820.1 hypothetical protein [Flavobacterium sp. CG_23.5]